MAEQDPKFIDSNLPRSVILGRNVVADTWPDVATAALSVEDFTTASPEEPLLVRLSAWQAVKSHIASGSSRSGPIGLLVSGGQALDVIGDDWQRFALVAVEFSSVADGRGFSLGRLIRERYQFKGEMRAVGPFTRDQLAYLERVGFNSFTLREGEDPQASLSAFDALSHNYQATAQHGEPIYRIRHRLNTADSIATLKNNVAWAD